MNRIRLLIMCEIQALGHSLKIIFSADSNFEVVGQAGCTPGEIDEAEKLQPDALICQVSPGADADSLVKKLKQVCPYTLLFGFVNSDSQEELIETMASDFDGFLFKTMQPTILLKTVDLACRSGILCFPSSMRRLLRSQLNEKSRLEGGFKRSVYSESENSGNKYNLPLTPREVEIYNFLLQNFSNKDICEKLYISQATVKSHVSSILRKMGLNSRTELLFLDVNKKYPGNGFKVRKDRYQ